MSLLAYVKRNWANGPGGGTAVNGPNLEAMDQQIDDLTVWALARPGAVTVSAWSLGPPASPADGDIWVAKGVDANGRRWMFQYNAASSHTEKWEFIGGAALQAHANPNSAIGAATVVLRTTGLRPGVYGVRTWAFVSLASGQYGQIGASVDNGLTQYNGNYVAQINDPGGIGAYVTGGVESDYPTAVGEIDAVVAASSSTLTLSSVHQAITPVRIS